MRLLAASVAVLLLAIPVAGRAAEIVVGAVYPSTGAGQDARHAIATALEIVNGAHERMPVLMGEGGGLDRLGGAKLQITFADDPGDPAKAADAAEHLVVDDHAVALIGGVSDASAAAISRVAERHGLPYLSLDSTLTNTGGLTWFFRIGRTPANDARSVLRLLGGIASANGRALQSVAIVFEDGAAGRDRAAPLHTAAEAAGVRVTDALVPPEAATFESVVETIAAGAPDAVLFALGGPREPALLPLLASRHLGPLVLMQRGDGAPTTDGVFRSISYTADSLPARPGVSGIDAMFKARAGKPLDTNAAREITGVLLLADVINRAASTKPIDLRTALMATDTPGGETPMLWDGVRFDDTGQNVLATPALQQVQQEVFKTVAPEPVATATPNWPAAK